jgi:hypothetical protein
MEPKIVHCGICHQQVIKRFAYLSWERISGEMNWLCFEDALKKFKDNTFYFEPYYRKKLRKVAKGLNLSLRW